MVCVKWCECVGCVGKWDDVVVEGGWDERDAGVDVGGVVRTRDDGDWRWG